MTGSIHLGTQGWSYKSWVGVFLPAGTPANAYLREYARQFSAVEIDATFYGTPRASTIKSWAEATPPGFRFTAKFPQAITHAKMLKDTDPEVAAFLDAMTQLGPKLGPLLLQFSYQFRPAQRAELETFLESLPSGFRFAVEVRHRGWLQEWFYEILSRRGVALVMADYAYMPKLTHTTADFAYMRWLGNRKDVPDDQYDRVRYPRTADLDRWSDVIADLVERGITIWGFANNHYMGHSPATVRELAERLKARGFKI